MIEIVLANGMWKRVEGYAIQIAGYEEFSFAVHEAVDNAGEIMPDRKSVV